LDAPVGKPSESSLGELFGRLADDGRAYLRAETELYKAIAARRAGKARNGAIALAAALFLLNAGLIVLLVGLSLELALAIGPALAGIAVFVVVAVIAFLLVRYGGNKLKALSGDAEERAALSAGETLP
jgi:hypothetical protein